VAAGDYPQARDHFKQAVALQPDDDVSRYLLGQVLMELGMPLQAQVHFEQALAVQTADSSRAERTRDALAEALYQQDRIESLLAFVTQVADENQQSVDYLRQAKYLRLSGDMDAAKVAYRKAAFFASAEDATPYVAIADFYDELGDQANLELALRFAYYVDPKDPTLPDRFRRLGLVPGPTLAMAPPKPQMLR